MNAAPKVDDIENEDNILTTKIKLTKNEYNATIRNKLEYNRLRIIKRHLGSQSDLNACKIRTSMHDLKKWLGDNQRVVCNIDEFFMTRKTQSASAHYRSRLPGVRSSLSRTNDDAFRNRPKSVSVLSRPYTAPLQTYYEQLNEIESDDEVASIPVSRLASGKYSVDRSSSSVLSQHPIETNVVDDAPIISSSASHRITWPVQLKVFALQDENESRKQFLAWRAEQRKSKARRTSKTFYDTELERKYRESIRRRQDIEAYATPELIEEHKTEDPIFAKRYRQLKIAVRCGKIPTYDPTDCELNQTVTKSKIERTRSALITAKQSKIKTFYRNQQNLHDAHLSNRIDTFLKRIAKLKEENEQERK